jgi:hypothetical protein
MDAETKAALERAAELCGDEAARWLGTIQKRLVDQCQKDAALIRAHIASETSAYEAGKADAAAKVVAWLRQQASELRKLCWKDDQGMAYQARGMDQAAHEIASGAHERNGDD